MRPRTKLRSARSRRESAAAGMASSMVKSAAEFCRASPSLNACVRSSTSSRRAWLFAGSVFAGDRRVSPCHKLAPASPCMLPLPPSTISTIQFRGSCFLALAKPRKTGRSWHHGIMDTNVSPARVFHLKNPTPPGAAKAKKATSLGSVGMGQHRNPHPPTHRPVPVPVHFTLNQ